MTTIGKAPHDLTADDLAAHAVWAIGFDPDAGEAGVQPAPTEAAADPDAGALLVRARFRLADGTVLAGYLTPPAASERGDPGVIQPVLVGDFGQVSLWWGAGEPGPADLAAAYGLLGRTAAQVFPLAFEADVALPDGPFSGTIGGFMYLPERSGCGGTCGSCR